MNFAKITKDIATAAPCGVCNWFGSRFLCATDIGGKITQNIAQGVICFGLVYVHPLFWAVAIIVALVKIKNVYMFATGRSN